MHRCAGLGDDRICCGAPQLLSLLSLKTAKVHTVRQLVGSHSQIAWLTAGRIAVGAGALWARRNNRGSLGVTGCRQCTELCQKSVRAGWHLRGRAMRVCALYPWAALSLGRGGPPRPQGEADSPGKSAIPTADGWSLVLLSTVIGAIVERLVAAAGAGQLRQLSERVDGGGGFPTV